VEQAGDAKFVDLVPPQAQSPAGGLGELADRAGVAERAERLEVSVVGEHATRLRKLVTLIGAGPRLARDDALPGVGRLDVLEHLLAVVTEQGGERRVERRAGTAPSHGDGHGHATGCGKGSRVAGDVEDAGGGRYLTPAGALRHALPVPALEHETQAVAGTLRQAQPHAQSFSDLAVAAEVLARKSRAGGNGRGERAQALKAGSVGIYVAP